MGPYITHLFPHDEHYQVAPQFKGLITRCCRLSDVRAGLGLKARAWARLSRAQAFENLSPSPRPFKAQIRAGLGLGPRACSLESLKITFTTSIQYKYDVEKR